MTDLPIDVGMSEEWVTRQEAEIERRRSARREKEMRSKMRVGRLIPIVEAAGALPGSGPPPFLVSIVVPASLAREVVRALEARATGQEDGEVQLGEPNLDSDDLRSLAEQVWEAAKR